MRGARVLILDDSQERLDQFTQRLIGNVCVTCMTARACIEHLQQDGPFHFLLLDHDLGGQVYVDSKDENTGAEVARFLASHPRLKPAKILVHSFNEAGRKYIKACLPEAVEAPGLWTQIVPESSTT